MYLDSLRMPHVGVILAVILFGSLTLGQVATAAPNHNVFPQAMRDPQFRALMVELRHEGFHLVMQDYELLEHPSNSLDLVVAVPFDGGRLLYAEAEGESSAAVQIYETDEFWVLDPDSGRVMRFSYRDYITARVDELGSVGDVGITADCMWWCGLAAAAGGGALCAFAGFPYGSVACAVIMYMASYDACNCICNDIGCPDGAGGGGGGGGGGANSCPNLCPLGGC